MKIAAIDVCPLTGATVDGGWPQGHEPQENLHTLLDRPDRRRARRATAAASPRASSWPGRSSCSGRCCRGESAVEPERVSETLRQSSFWQGRGGSVEHAISGIDIALWDLMGKACGQPVSRLLGRQLPADDQAVRLDPLRRARAAAADARERRRARVQGDQAGLAAVRPARPAVRRAARPDGPRRPSATASS